MLVETKSIVSSAQFKWATIQAVAGMLSIFHSAYPQAGWLALASSIVMMVIRYQSDGTPVSLTGGMKVK